MTSDRAAKGARQLGVPPTLPVGQGPPTLSDIYSSGVGDEAPRKLPLAVARDLEERFVRDGWPTGAVYGSASALAAHYGVGRDVMREAVRILEGRGVARVRRGPRGGVVVGAPSQSHLVDMVSGFAHLTGVTSSEITDAWVVIHVGALGHVGERIQDGCRWDPDAEPSSGSATSDSDYVRRFAAEVIERSGNHVSRHFSEIMSSLLPEATADRAHPGLELLQRSIIEDLNEGRVDDAVRRGRELFAHVCPASGGADETDAGPRPPDADTSREMSTPALEVVRRFMAAMPPDDWVAGRALGNEFDIAESLGVDRSVVRQAIRMLEAAETAVAVPGRGHGLTTRRPTGAPLSRLVCVYLASCHEPIADARAAVAGLMSEASRLAAHEADSHEVAALHRLLEDVHELTGSIPASGLQPIERLQHRLAGNALLSLLLDGAHAYAAWNATEEATLPSWAVERYVRSTQAVLEAIAAGDAARASQLETVKQGALMRCRTDLRPGGGWGG